MNLVNLKQKMPFDEFPGGQLLYYIGARHKSGYYIKVNGSQIWGIADLRTLDVERSDWVCPAICLSEHEYRLYSNIMSVGFNLELVTFLGKYYWTWNKEGDFHYVSPEEAMIGLIDRAAGGYVEYQGKRYKWYAPGGMFVAERDPFEQASHTTKILQRYLKAVLPEDKIKELTTPLASAIEEAKRGRADQLPGEQPRIEPAPRNNG